MRDYLGALGVGVLATVASVAVAQASGADAELEAMCRATETAVPDSCPCTIEASRKANVSDAQMRALFADDGHSQPVDEGTYERFWLAKIECMSSTTIAGFAPPALSAPPTNPVSTPQPQAITQNTSQPYTDDPAGDYPWGLRQTEVVQMTPDQARTALGQLRNTRWVGGTLAINPPRSIQTTLNFRPDGLLTVTYDDPLTGENFGVVYSLSVDDIDPNRAPREGREIGYSGVVIGPDGLGRRGDGRLAQFPIQMRDLSYDSLSLDRLMIDYRGGDDLVWGQDGRQGYLNFAFTKAGEADLALPSDLSANARHRVAVAQSKATGGVPSLANRFGTIESRTLGDAACNDDLVLIPQGSAMPATMGQFLDRSLASTRRQIAIGYWGDPGQVNAYEVRFDGERRILRETSAPGNGVREFVDGSLSMTWRPGGAGVSDGAFGFSPLNVTLATGDTKQEVRAVLFGGC